MKKIYPDISKLGGGLKLCKIEGCCNLTHREDAPDAYPCCEHHISANKTYWEIQKEKRYYEEINKELYN